jgi:hypothetical protein
MGEPTSGVNNDVPAVATGGSSVISAIYITKHVKAIVLEALNPIRGKLSEMKDSANKDVTKVIYIILILFHFRHYLMLFVSFFHSTVIPLTQQYKKSMM